MTIEKVHEQRIKERRKMEHNINDTDDIVEKMRLLVADGTIWLTQKEIAELFQTTKQSIGMHIRFILKHGELDERVVVSYRLADRKQGTMQGKLQVRKTAHYNSDMVLAGGGGGGGEGGGGRLRAVCAHQGGGSSGGMTQRY